MVALFGFFAVDRQTDQRTDEQTVESFRFGVLRKDGRTDHGLDYMLGEPK
jgi:hypothetical protein